MLISSGGRCLAGAAKKEGLSSLVYLYVLYIYLKYLALLMLIVLLLLLWF